LETGDTVDCITDHYEITDLLGKSGMGESGGATRYRSRLPSTQGITNFADI